MVDLVFDAHLHIIAPGFPIKENQGYLPDLFTIADYKDHATKLGIHGGAVVSGSFQGFDQTYLVAALAELGRNFVGVTQLPATASDQELIELDEKGVKAIRFNLKRGGSEGIDQVDRFARRVYDLLGWHSEFYADTAEADSIIDLLCSLPKASIDHLGLSSKGIGNLYRLLESGLRVKATGFGRVDFDPFKVIGELYSYFPEQIMFGTDLPSTRAPVPFKDQDLYELQDRLGPEAFKKITWNNAAHWYGIE